MPKPQKIVIPLKPSLRKQFAKFLKLIAKLQKAETGIISPSGSNASPDEAIDCIGLEC
jgi:hypothetical protein